MTKREFQEQSAELVSAVLMIQSYGYTIERVTTTPKDKK